METAAGDSVFGIKTRSKKTVIDAMEEVQLLKETPNSEVQELVEDQIYQSFVEKVVNPDHGPLSEDLTDEFIPNEDAVIEAEDGGSSEEELDEEEVTNPPNEDEIVEVTLDAAVGDVAMLKNVPAESARAYKKRFPHFWRMKKGLHTHTGKGYDHEEDPDFTNKITEEDPDFMENITEEGDEAIESSSDDESSSSEEEEEEMINDEEISKLTSMVEDMVIPDEVEEVDIEEDSGSEESDDEIDTNEPNHLDLLNDQKDLVYDSDVEYKPMEPEGDVSIEESSDDSYVSAETSEDESEQVENMDE
jgi:hypothetical protein